MDNDTSPRRSRMGCAAALVLLAVVLAALAAFLFERLSTWPARTARQVRDAFADVAQLQPRVTVQEQTFFEQTAPILELAVVTRPTQVERETESAFLGSRKRVRLRGTYEVRAGFDLTKPFEVTVDGKVLRVILPPPRILTVEQKNFEVLDFDNGFWNKIQPSELEGELKTLPLLARQRASESGLQREALQLFTQRLKDKFAGQYDVDVQIAQPDRSSVDVRRD